ncbi:hypothetical protein ACHAXM_007504 [Skeletonema potamos]|jgi:hypothetical protein
MKFGSKNKGDSSAKATGSSRKHKKEQEPEKPSFFTTSNSDQNGTEVEASSLFRWGDKKEEVPVVPATTGRFFPWSKKKQEPVVVAPPPPPPEPVAPATPPRSSSSMFSFGGRKKSIYGSPSSRSVATAPPTPSPPRKSNSKRVEHETIYDEKTRRNCCSCKCFIGCSCLFILLAIAGVLTWRYGPWFQNSASSTNLRVQSCPDCCNGSRSNCKLPVNKVIFPTLHRAHASKDHSFIGASHDKQFEDALVAGYRGLQLNTCVCENILSLSKGLLARDEALGLQNSNMGFCHSACGTGVRDPTQVIENIKNFLDVNPREVLLVDVDMNEGSENDLRTAMRASGLLDYVYIPDSKYVEWPRMEKLIDKNKRLLLFGRGGSLRSCDAPDCRDGILYFYDFFAQTAPDGSDVTSCDSTLSGEIHVDYFLLNHFQNNAAMLPSPTIAKDLNSYNELSARFEDCQGKIEPNLLSVEFWQQGDVLEFVQKQNEKRYELLKLGFSRRGLRGWLE